MPVPIPTLAPGSQVLRLDDRSVAVRTWHRTFQLRGAHADAAARVIEAIDGSRTLAAVARHAGVEASLAEAVAARMRDAGVLSLGDADDADGGPWPARPGDVLDIAAGAMGVDDVPPRTGDVLVVGRGRTAELLADRLGEVEERPIQAVGSADELPEALPGGTALPAGLVHAEELTTYRDALAIDRWAAAADVPWCAGWWEGSRLVVSHEIRFGRSACFECLLERQRANYLQPEVDIPLEERLRSGTMTTAGTNGERAVPALLCSMLTDLLVLRTRSLLSGPGSSTRPRELGELDLRTWSLRWSTVLRLPSCRHCSPGVLRPPSPTA